jgi:hypothetical protein
LLLQILTAGSVFTTANAYYCCYSYHNIFYLHGSSGFSVALVLRLTVVRPGMFIGCSGDTNLMLIELYNEKNEGLQVRNQKNMIQMVYLELTVLLASIKAELL